MTILAIFVHLMPCDWTLWGPLAEVDVGGLLCFGKCKCALLAMCSTSPCALAAAFQHSGCQGCKVCYTAPCGAASCNVCVQDVVTHQLSMRRISSGIPALKWHSPARDHIMPLHPT